MSRQGFLDVSPPRISGMKKDVLDRDQLRKSLIVLAARVPVLKTGAILRSSVMRRLVQESKPQFKFNL
jgi:hypothetical protein